MTCSDVEKVLPEILDGAPDAAFQTDFDVHLKACPACSDLVSDLKLISGEARQLAETEEPSPRVWLRLAAELRAENLIREPASEPGRPVRLPDSFRRRQWSAWWLAPVAAALLAAGAYVVSHRPAPQIAKHDPTTSAPAPVPAARTLEQAAAVHGSSDPAPVAAPPRRAQKAPKAADVVAAAVEPAPSAEDQQFLSVVSTRAPSMRATYENQLQAVNADIRETQAYVNRNPGDADARQHLMDAYEQKALLYQIALDRIQ
jgi:Putative zinc-finger